MKLTDALTVLLVGLKLTNQIDWGWFFVCLPFIVSVALAFAVTMARDGR